MLKYAYNAQIPVEILPDDDGCVILNNNRIPLKNIVIAPMRPITKADLSNVTIKGKGQFDNSKLNGKTETDPLMFAYTEEIDENVLGETLHLYVHIFIFNCAIKKKELPSGKEIGQFMLNLTPADNERMFSSTMYYLTEDEFVGHPMDNDYINSFYYAEELLRI